MMHERLGYWLFREMGVPAPRSTHARVIVNGDYVGIFALTEELDGRFTRENFDDGTGNLYKEVWPFAVGGIPQTADTLIAGLETNEDEDPNADIMTGFANELAAAPGRHRDRRDRQVARRRPAGAHVRRRPGDPQRRRPPPLVLLRPVCRRTTSTGTKTRPSRPSR